MQRAEQVGPGALSQLPGLSAELTPDGRPPPSESAARLALAGWLTDSRNPLTYRVVVNRVWQHHFGRGLVGTPSDFGRNGEPPSHPALLDWLAADFVENGRRLKRLHKMIVTSYAYTQSSAAGPGLAVDAGNRLIWRMPLRRMEAEAVRDSILAVSGKLDRKMYGPGFALFKYKVVNVGIYEPLTDHGPTTWRRAIYQQAARAVQDNMLAAFDCPECAVRSPKRESTTTPQQAMSLLNGPFTVSQAGYFAARVRNEAGVKPEAQVERAFLLALSRAPSEPERKAALDLAGRHGLPALCRALFNANEFLYY
jgi:hypothetical protein